MEPHLNKNDKLLFYKYLDKAKVYFEFGSGGSTYQASIRDNIEYICSVESDLVWYNNLQKLIKNRSRINYIYNDINTIPNNWGNPGLTCPNNKKINYSEHIRLLEKDKSSKIDLILIDGRFRVACCLKCYDVINDDCYILFDDFLNRKYYHIVLDYYDIVDKTEDNIMVVLKKKKGKKIQNDIIKKYEIIHQ